MYKRQIQVFFLYFGLSKIGLKLDGFTCGIIGLAFLGGSYMAEAIRGGLEAVSKGQIESALSIGLTPFQAFRYVIFPQAFAIATPAIGANCLFLMKETSVISEMCIRDSFHRIQSHVLSRTSYDVVADSPYTTHP